MRKLETMELNNNYKLNINDLEKEIIITLEYFLFFNYPPTFEEIYTFLKNKAAKRRIRSILEIMQKKGVITRLFNNELRITDKKKDFDHPTNLIKSVIRNPQSKTGISGKRNLYTPPEYRYRLLSGKNKTSGFPTKQWNNYLKRQQISMKKLNSVKFNFYLRFLSFFPQIKLVGLSGSLAMLNADDNHDIDLFIITAKNRLWTGRIITLFFAQLLGLRRKRHHEVIPESMSQSGNFFKNKVCLNLFFTESRLEIAKIKQTEYVAHEVLQMKPLVDKNNTYMRFIDANKWVFDIFPNAKNNSEFRFQNSELNSEVRILNSKSILNSRFIILNLLSNKVEGLLKKLQLHYIRKHQTTEIVTSSQLWFHPEDFEKKIKPN